MLKKLASDALGLSDIGKIIEPKNFDKTDSDDFVRHEDGEKIYFLIVTKSDEYCFTNLALIHVDGQSAVSSKRVMRRYPYELNEIRSVELETAGKIDLDCEIKFTIGGIPFSIDVTKKEIEKVKELYKALLYMSEQMHENNTMLGIAENSLKQAIQVLQSSRSNEKCLSQEYQAITEYGFHWMESKREHYIKKDYSHVFEKYIKQ